MPISMTQDVLMVAPGGVEFGLGSTANRNGWPVLDGLSIPQMLRQVLTHSPRVVVVQLGQMLEQTMHLIGSIHELRPDTKVIVAATTHHELLEQASRCAGASAYLPDVSDDEAIEQTVASLTHSSADAEVRREAAIEKAAKARSAAKAARVPVDAFAYTLIIFLLSMLGVSTTHAAITNPIVLHDKSDYAYFNIPGVTGYTNTLPTGLYDTVRSVFEPASSTVDYQTHDVNQQWFWFSVNGGPVQAINAISTPTVALINKNPSQDANPDRLRLTYEYNSGGKSFELKVTYDLTGTGQYGATLGLVRTVSITNLSSSTLNLNFYDYSNLTLSRADKLTEESQFYPDHGDVISSDGRTVHQWDYDGTGVNADGSPRLNTDSETQAFTDPTVTKFGVLANNGLSGGVLPLVTAGSTLLNTTINTDQGPGNLDFVFEYNLSLASGQGWIGGADLLIVPSPGSLSVLVMMAPCLLVARPRRRRDRRFAGVAPTSQRVRESRRLLCGSPMTARIALAA